MNKTVQELLRRLEAHLAVLAGLPTHPVARAVSEGEIKRARETLAALDGYLRAWQLSTPGNPRPRP